MRISFSKMRNPNRCVHENHRCSTYVLLRGIGRRALSVLPSLANLFALSRDIKASNPRLTKEVFSLIPVSFDALFRSFSSMFNVVLICIYMHKKCIYVKMFVEHLGDALRDCVSIFDFAGNAGFLRIVG